MHLYMFRILKKIWGIGINISFLLSNIGHNNAHIFKPYRMKKRYKKLQNVKLYYIIWKVILKAPQYMV